MTPAEDSGARERPRDFVAALERAVRDGDADFLVGRLHPAVEEVYGPAPSREYAASRHEPGARITLVWSGPPEAMVWTAASGERRNVADVVAARVRVAWDGGAGVLDCHLAYLGRRLHWFCDLPGA